MRQQTCHTHCSEAGTSCGRSWPTARACRRARSRRRAPPPRPSAPPDQPDSNTAGAAPRLADPAGTIVWGGTLPSSRRALLGGLSGLAIALGGNLGGVTSALLGLDGGATAAALRLDVLVPVRGAKRCVSSQYGFEFTYPASWLGDQTLVSRAAQRAEAARGGPLGSPDSQALPPLAGSRSAAAAAAARRRRAEVAEPVAAFGPPGGTGEENVSVIVAPIMPGFTLRSLGPPRAAGDWLLATVVPAGSGLTAELLAVGERREQGQGQEQLYYTLEYVVRGPRFVRHNVGVYTTRDDLLYTYNAQCPEARWDADGQALLASAASFRLS